jgi:hypothetical protein
MDKAITAILEGAAGYDGLFVEWSPKSGRWNRVPDESVLESRFKKRYEVTPKLCGRVTFAGLDGL